MKFICPFCRSILNVDNSDLGIDVQCGQCGEISRAPLSQISSNVVIGNDFVVLEELGRGGMGIVYLTHQISLDRPAALKILAKKYADNNEFIAGFIKEARAAAKLNHPNIVQAYAVGEDSGVYFFAMEYIEGETMKEVLKKQNIIPVENAVEIIRQIADALDFAWKEQRLIHRDIKPDNIMIVSKNQRAKLADLGLARVAGEIDDSKEDEVMGTPQYISPEALTGSPMDVRSDIYSLGATFYHLLTGVFPFTGKTALEIAKKHLQEPLKNPRIVHPEIPEAVADIVMKMMNKNPDDRYQTAEALVEDLRLSKKGVSPKKGKPVVFHTGQMKAIVPTSTSTQRMSTSSSNLGMGSSTLSGKIDTGAIRAAKEKKSARIFALLILTCILILAGVAGFAIWKHQKKGAKAEETTKPVTKKTQDKIILKPPEKKEPQNTEYTETVAKIIEFAKKNPDSRSDILVKCDMFLAKNQTPSYKCDRDALNALLAIFVPLDEKYRLSEARKRERASYEATIEKFMEEERRKKLNEEEKLKILRKEEDMAKLQKQRIEEMKLKLEEYAMTLERKKEDLSYKTLVQTAEKRDFLAALAILDEARNEPDSVEVEFKDKARDFVKWVENYKNFVDKAKVFSESLANRSDNAIKINIEVRPGAYGKVQKILNGEIFIETSSKKIEKNSLMKIPVSQYKKIAYKLTSDADAPFLAMLFSGGFEGLVQLDASPEIKTESDKIVKAYLKGKINNINNSPENTDKLKELNLLKVKYGRLPQYKEAVDGAGK
ncbi:MAG TPA: protein kinase [Victivallales bacterium]|nr:protein kinase [Victivallales bacterium]